MEFTILSLYEKLILQKAMKNIRTCCLCLAVDGEKIEVIDINKNKPMKHVTDIINLVLENSEGSGEPIKHN